MSELTLCNHCKLHDIKRRARENGKLVVLRATSEKAFPLGQDVFVSPKGTEYSKRFQAKYRVAWFMELTDHCAC